MPSSMSSTSIAIPPTGSSSAEASACSRSPRSCGSPRRVRRVLADAEGSDVLATTAFAGALVGMAGGIGAETLNLAAALRAQDDELSDELAQSLFEANQILGSAATAARARSLRAGRSGGGAAQRPRAAPGGRDRIRGPRRGAPLASLACELGRRRGIRAHHTDLWQSCCFATAQEEPRRARRTAGITCGNSRSSRLSSSSALRPRPAPANRSIAPEFENSFPALLPIAADREAEPAASGALGPDERVLLAATFWLLLAGFALWRVAGRPEHDPTPIVGLGPRLRAAAAAVGASRSSSARPGTA